MKGSLWTVAVLACALVLVIPLANAGYEEATSPRDASEEAEVSYSTAYELQQQDVQGYRNLTITNSSGVTLVNGTDYTFDQTAGEVTFLNTSNTSSGELVDVEYTYLVHTAEQQAGEQLFAALAPWLGFSLLIAAMGYLTILLVGGSGF